MTKKQRNTTHHRGAYINTPKSGDGIANMSAVHYSNPQQLIIDTQLKNNQQGPVPQRPIKLIPDWWKILIAIYLPLKKDFSQD